MDFTFTLLRSYLRSICFLLLVVSFSLKGFALTWFPFGPDGGDARAFAQDPRDHHHLYLGTTNGWIYESHDGGESWKRLARLGHHDDLVADNIVVDPLDSKHILAGTWLLGGTDGGLYVSHDGGVSWTDNPEMKGQSIRALAIAPSNAKILVAGTLDGVFRSEDGGEHWARISPTGSKEIHEVESIAIDPVDPQILYAGTWHLPWKTTDGGEHWNNIKQGIIDDSDVFSILVDPKQPQVVYASACSGIYKSDNAGEKFVKVQGIPSSARRTRVLMQDPEHLSTVFAGTTEGLFRTDDAGTYWNQATGSDVIVNDVYVDPTNSQHVLLATEHGGVLASHDGGVSFFGSNAGFSVRQVTAFVEDARRPSDVYIGVVNDKQYGGAFLSEDGGLKWVQHASGLEGRDVLSMSQAANGMIVAGTEDGIFWYDKQEELWKRTGEIGAAEEDHLARPARRGASEAARSRSAAKRAVAKPVRQIEGNVVAIAPIGDRLWAVTSEGVYSSDDPSGVWQAVEGVEGGPWQYVASSHGVTMLANRTSIVVSMDAGKSWRPVQLPTNLTQVRAIAVDDQGELWVGGREGVFFSMDRGTSWTTLKSVNVIDVNSIYFDARHERMLITANASTTMAFGVNLANKVVKYWDTGWNLRFLRPVGDYLVGATLFDGIVVQPRMVQSK